MWLSGFTEVTLVLFVSIDHPSHREDLIQLLM